MTHDLADLFIDALTRVVQQLEKQEKPLRGKESSSFAHGTR
jgi:glutamate decarboxylase